MDRMPEHWCKVPTLISAEWTAEDRKAASIPKLVIGKIQTICLQHRLMFLIMTEFIGRVRSTASARNMI